MNTTDYIKERAAAFNAECKHNDAIKAAYIKEHGELVGLLLYREYLNKKYPD